LTDPSAIPVRRLDRTHRAAMTLHLLNLAREDRRLRFGATLDDAAVADYVARIDFERDAVFGVFADDLSLAGVAHVAAGGATAEFGVSVLPDARRRGVGSALFERASVHARTHHIREMFMHCLLENRTMMHIARKSGMRIVMESGEADAWLELPPAGVATVTQEFMAERIGLFDFALKQQREAARRLAVALAGGAAD
jgi:GNAT superfamily N-acetyltransferase